MDWFWTYPLVSCLLFERIDTRDWSRAARAFLGFARRSVPNRKAQHDGLTPSPKKL